MGSPNPKRRKTSPLAEARSEGQRTPRRASFMSPTKASLARFNPSLLPRPRSSGSDAAQTSGDGDPEKGAGVAYSASAAAKLTVAGAPLNVSLPGEEDELASPSPAPTPSGAKKPIRNKALGLRLSRSPERTDARPRDTTATATRKLPSRPASVARTQPAKDTDADDVDPLAIPLPDPTLIALQQERDDLLRRAQELGSEVRDYEREIRTWSQPVDDANPPDKSSLIALIERHEEHADETSSPPILPLSQLLSSFMPFASLTAQPPPSPPSSPPFKTPSHLPLPSHSLPHLQLFTPFTVSHTLSLPSPPNTLSPSSPGLLQTHTYTLTTPQNNFHCTVTLTLSASTHTINAISIPSLSPWAEPELGSHIRHLATTLDIGAITWSLNSFYRLALKRATTLLSLSGEFPHLLSTPHENLASILPFSSLSFRSTDATFSVSWDITFDWTGEAQSSVTATASVPKAWRESDERGIFGKVPETFDMLVREKGVQDAVGIMVKVLFG